MFPFEYLKTVLQLHPGRYTGMRHCASSALRAGPLALYQGLSPHLLFAFPRVAIRFSLYEAVGDALRARDAGGGARGAPDAQRPLRGAEVLLAGLIAGFAEGAIATVPLTTLSVRLCADAASPSPRFTRGLPHTMAALWREEGWRGWYKAPAATLLKVTTQIGARFVLFEELVASLRRAAGGTGTGTGGALDSALTVAAGALSGGITVLLNQPIDVVKSRLQAPGGGAHSGMLGCARAVVAAGGVRGLYAGTLPRLVRVMGETGLTFLFYARISETLNIALDGRP